MKSPLDKHLLFVTGKGGVGKTTVAYALATAAAADGKRAIVCETAGQDRGARIFGVEPRGFSEEELAPGLWTISIGFEDATKDYLERQMPVRSMGSILARSNLFSYLAAATPGLQEMVTMGKIWEVAHAERRRKLDERVYDLVIVDSPATGHGITFLRTPGEFESLARVGPLSNQAGRIARTLSDHDNSGIVVVSQPEEMAVSEAILLQRSLGDGDGGSGFAIDRHYVNGVRPDRFSDDEVATDRGLDRRRRRRRGRRTGGALRVGDGRQSRRADTPPRGGGIGAGHRDALPLRPGGRAGPSSPRSPTRSVERLDRGHAGRGVGLHLRRLRRGREDDELRRDRGRHGRPRAQGGRADDRPGEAAGRLARAA